MILRNHIAAWQSVAPWPDNAQVEQDLVLSRATVELFTGDDLPNWIALRGGTALNKLFIVPGVRYSEDIDLVQTTAGAAGPLMSAIRSRLDPWLGKPKRDRAEGGFSLVYRFESEGRPTRTLRLKIEVNTREHFTVLGMTSQPLTVANPWFTGNANVTTYRLDELMGTKLRALFQRRKGRDLFDLWLCLDRKLVDPQQVLACFHQYMKHEGRAVSRAQFEENLHNKQTDPLFKTDIASLLTPAFHYDETQAMNLVRSALIDHLPGAPWRGSQE